VRVMTRSCFIIVMTIRRAFVHGNYGPMGTDSSEPAGGRCKT
jgi:hypothetical protein